MSVADTQLDARLQDVPLPGGLLGRLMALPLAEDQDMDELLGGVPLPPGLLERLRAIALADDDGLDEALRNVPVPGELVASCRRHARVHLAQRRHSIDRAWQISRIAMLASLIMAVTLSVGSAMLFSWYICRLDNLLPVPPDLAKNNSAPPTPVEKRLESSWSASIDEAPGSDSRRSQPGFSPRTIELADIDPSAAWAANDRLASGAVPPGANLLAPTVAAYGYGLPNTNSWDELPELSIRVPYPVPHGLDWPLVPPANRPFLVLTGFHPFVSPAAHSRLQSCQVPLAVEASSYELARRYLERNERPLVDRDHNSVRTEEFLAAVDYNFPKPQNRALGLIVAGGPSPISGEGYCLLQIGVQARQGAPPRTRRYTSWCWSIPRRACGGAAAWRSSAGRWANCRE